MNVGKVKHLDYTNLTEVLIFMWFYWHFCDN